MFLKRKLPPKNRERKKKAFRQCRHFELQTICFKNTLKRFIIFTLFIIHLINRTVWLECYKCNDSVAGRVSCIFFFIDFSNRFSTGAAHGDVIGVPQILFINKRNSNCMWIYIKNINFQKLKILAHNDIYYHFSLTKFI